MKKLMQALVLSLAVLSVNIVLAEPTVQDIYKTAQVDKQQALTMVNEVIKLRPNSARAHYVQSELLLQLGKKSEAKAAFLKSQSLDSSLSFAKPESVERLRTALGVKETDTLKFDTDKAILWGGGFLLVLLIAFMLFKRRKPAQQYPDAFNASYNRPVPPFTPPPPAGAAVAPAAAAPASSGSGLMGSLATGAAMGVGVAAGATLANHLLNGNKATAAPVEQQPSDTPSYTPDQNFGVSDSSSGWGGDSDGGSDSSDW
jgi:hypothetical protein